MSAPVPDSPYWQAIVGDDWPEISPAEWSRLAEDARSGAAALDVDDAEQARAAFDELVRSGVGLQPVKDAMGEQQRDPRAFADALNATADALQDISDLVYRTRNRILDVVDDAALRIRAVADVDDDVDTEQGSESAIPSILATARDEVRDIVTTAQDAVDPSGIPSLAAIAELLGQPAPWNDSRPFTPVQSSWPEILGAADDPAQPEVEAAAPGESAAVSESDIRPSHDVDSGSPQNAPTLAPGISRITGMPGMIAAQDNSFLGDPNTVVARASRPLAGTDVATPAASEQDAQVPDSAPATEASTEPGAGAGTTAAAGLRSPAPDVVADAMSVAALSGVPISPVASPPVAPAAPTGRPMPPGAESRLPPAGPKVIAGPAAPGSPAVPRVSAPTHDTAGSQSPQRYVAGDKSQHRQRTAEESDLQHRRADEPDYEPRLGEGSDYQRPAADRGSVADPARPGGSAGLREAVGAAMAAAASAFVVGQRIDGDLVLARTILSSLLAVDSRAVGLAWAVSVMRHPGGVSAFVTSNEGRGWIPAGIFLPRELSTPWVWEVSADGTWESVADPARVLMEFGLAWGRISGARVSALVSSRPIDPALRAQVRDVALEGAVQPGAAVDFGAPGAGSVDRLGLVAAPRLIDRAESVPDDQLSACRIELAVDAHLRVAELGRRSAESQGVRELRERILRSIQQGQVVPEPGWEELRDADDLLAAMILSRHLDVSRVPLGELRSELTDVRSASTVALLRQLVFERRCDELVLLLAAEPTRQGLRDAMYAHAQIIDHPFSGTGSRSSR
ncbi:hypothetical protein ACFVMC_29405 [Nocardia sp. NPDC127579]|uniref:hypothetical protein n=1 Tax=Nocardia sp. NPDC127579 TaxID=3345402 RepID=UPI003634633C